MIFYFCKFYKSNHVPICTTVEWILFHCCWKLIERLNRAIRMGAPTTKEPSMQSIKIDNTNACAKQMSANCNVMLKHKINDTHWKNFKMENKNMWKKNDAHLHTHAHICSYEYIYTQITTHIIGARVWSIFKFVLSAASSRLICDRKAVRYRRNKNINHSMLLCCCCIFFFKQCAMTQ